MRADARCRVATPESNALPDSSALSGHVHGRTLLSTALYDCTGFSGSSVGSNSTPVAPEPIGSGARRNNAFAVNTLGA
jgi:hypothetical protein